MLPSPKTIRPFYLVALLGIPLVAGAAAPRQIAIPSFFEPSGATFVGRVPGSSVEISAGTLRLTPQGEARPFSLRWSGAADGALQGEQPTGGVSNYYPGADEAAWRTAIPQYAKVRARNVYPGIDVVYYVDDGQLEFDLEIQPGVNPGVARLQLPAGATPSLDSTGQLNIESMGRSYRFKQPRAYQVRNGARQDVTCGYVASATGEIRFELGRYDRSIPLVVDPVIEYMTYLGGSGIDEVQVLAVDSVGNLIAGGVTTSANFPGAAQPLGAGLSLFITKLNASGSAVIFTTVLGTDQTGLLLFMAQPGGGESLTIDRLRSIVSDGGINTFAVGIFTQANFPTTAGAWQRNGDDGFALKLDASGQLAYSTRLGPPTFGLSAVRIRVRGGIAYIAGTTSNAEFLGTTGALQRGVAGDSDLFALGLASDGSHPTFLTAFGGTGRESLADMDLDANGNLILAGTSSSSDLPLTPDAISTSAPVPGATTAMLVRIDSQGSRLLYSTWLGTDSANGLVVTPDGNYVVAGSSTLPADIANLSLHHTINLGADRPAGYIAKFASATNRPLWSTDFLSHLGAVGMALSTDGLGNLYWTGSSSAYSGGAIFLSGQTGPTKLSADGSALLYSSPLPAGFATGVVAADGTYYVGGWTDRKDFPVTTGALQPHRDPAPAAPVNYGVIYDPLNYSDGFLGKLDLGKFSRGNFFLTTPPLQSSITWRIGQPLPESLTIPILVSGDAGSLTATGSSRLTASYITTPSSALAVNVELAQKEVGTFTESATLASQTNPDASLAIPVTLIVKPNVDFNLDVSETTIRVRQGPTPAPAVVGLTTAFGNERFAFEVASTDRSLLYGYVQCDSGPCQLKIQTLPQPPGSYEGTLTVGLQGLANPKRTLRVHYIVDPPATLQLSPASVQLHVVKGQPVQPVKIAVTGSVPGVAWTIFVGICPTWLSVTQSATTTPGEVVITADSASAAVGSWSYVGYVTSESGQQTEFAITVNVNSGAAIDVSPEAISFSYARGGEHSPPSPTIAVIAPAPIDFTISVDQPWVKPGLLAGKTSTMVSVALDATLPEGKYHATLTVSAAGTAVEVPIDWEIYDIPKLAISVTELSFQYRIGDPAPAAQQIKVTSPTQHPADFLLSLAGASDLFSIDPLYGSTPTTLNVAPVVKDLEPGTYQAQIMIQATYGSTGSFTVPLTLTVVPQFAPPPAIASVVDAASRLPGVVSPGEIISLTGSRLAPAGRKVSSAPGSNGTYPVTISGSTVYFDKLPAPVLYSSESETLVVVPFGLAGRSTTKVTVVAAAGTSTPTDMTVAATNPSLFTSDSSGYGLASAQNVGAGGRTTVHSRGNPAAPGTVVTLFATGLGVTSPALTDGRVVANPTPALSASIQAFVGGAAADVVSSGPVPGSIAGLMRVNVRIPQGIPSGLAQVVIVAGGNPSQTGVTLAIK